MTNLDWRPEALRALSHSGVGVVPFVPDGALAPLIVKAEAEGFRLVSVAREEEGVGVLSGVYLAGRRGALLMQSSGMGNSLNVIGSLSMAQRIPLPIIVTERGGLGEKVATQIPFGHAMTRMLELMGIPVFELSRVDETFETIVDAVEMAYISRVTTVTIIKSALSRGDAG